MSTASDRDIAAVARLTSDAAATTYALARSLAAAATDRLTISQIALADRRGLCPRTIRRHLQHLERERLIHRQPNRDPLTGFRTADTITILPVAADLAARWIAHSRAAQAARRDQQRTRRSENLAGWLRRIAGQIMPPTGQHCLALTSPIDFPRKPEDFIPISAALLRSRIVSTAIPDG